MLANNLTSDTRKYKVLSIMFLLVATNNPRGLTTVEEPVTKHEPPLVLKAISKATGKSKARVGAYKPHGLCLLSNGCRPMFF